MEELNKKISGLRELMKDMKTEMYAIVNPDLVALDEYTKNLYLKMLCTVVQYENEPSEMQVLYLKRIVKGIGVEEPLEEHMRKALAISEVDINEFLSFMRENLARYYFALESMLLASMGNSKIESFEYLAEILELSEINKRDLEFLSLVAKSVLKQDSAYYEDSKRITPDECSLLNFRPYISNYYVGAIVDNKYVKSFFAPSKESCLDVEFPVSYTANEVTFSHMVLSIEDEWKFESCEMVLFEDCDIYGSVNSIVFDACKSVQFRNCRISDFTTYVIIKKLVGELIFVDCEFYNCVYTYERDTNDWMMLGGVIHLDKSVQSCSGFFEHSSNNNLSTRIDRCIFTDCGGRNSTNYYSSAVISNDKCEVTNSKFVNCWNWHNNTKRDPEDNLRILFAIGSKSENNELVGSCQLA